MSKEKSLNHLSMESWICTHSIFGNMYESAFLALAKVDIIMLIQFEMNVNFVKHPVYFVYVVQGSYVVVFEFVVSQSFELFEHLHIFRFYDLI